MTKEEQIRQECWDKALHTLGTSYVFSLKANIYKKRIRIITVLGVIAPLLLGATVAAYGLNSNLSSLALTITTPVTIFQIVFSGISLVYRWDDQLAYSLESQTDNRIISDQFQNLGKYSATDINELEKQFEILKVRDNARTVQDEKIKFSNKDNRKGMRYALWIRQKECATCKIIPSSMNPTSCETCGKF